MFPKQIIVNVFVEHRDPELGKGKPCLSKDASCLRTPSTSPFVYMPSWKNVVGEGEGNNFYVPLPPLFVYRTSCTNPG